MKITEAQIIELLENEGIDFDGYGDDIVIEFGSYSGHDYIITLTPTEDGVEASTSKDDHECEVNVKLIKTIRGLKNYITKMINR